MLWESSSICHTIETICHTAVQKDPFALGYVIDEGKAQGVFKLATA